MSRFTWAEAGSETVPNAATVITRTFLFMAILRSAKRSLACRIFQSGHDGLSRMVLAPGLYVRDVFLMGYQVDCGLAKLIAEPAAHPGRKVTRLRGGHCEILLAPDVGHLDGQLRIGSQRRNKNRDCHGYQSECHFALSSDAAFNEPRIS